VAGQGVRGLDKSRLSDEQLREERERFVRRYQDPAVAVGFREQCERLACESAP
jgi:hypothetical protein